MSCRINADPECSKMQKEHLPGTKQERFKFVSVCCTGSDARLNVGKNDSSSAISHVTSCTLYQFTEFQNFV